MRLRSLITILPLGSFFFIALVSPTMAATKNFFKRGAGGYFVEKNASTYGLRAKKFRLGEEEEEFKPPPCLAASLSPTDTVGKMSLLLYLQAPMHATFCTLGLRIGHYAKDGSPSHFIGHVFEFQTIIHLFSLCWPFKPPYFGNTTAVHHIST